MIVTREDMKSLMTCIFHGFDPYHRSDCRNLVALDDDFVKSYMEITSKHNKHLAFFMSVTT